MPDGSFGPDSGCGDTDAPGPRPSAEEVLQEGLSAHFGRPVRITETISEAMYTFSTHPIYRLHLTLDSSEPLSVIFKRLHPLYGKDIRREVRTYRRLLAGQRFGAPALYASLCSEAHQTYWLFLEDLGEWRLDWCEVDAWFAAFRWMAGMHAAYYGREEELRALDCLGEHDAAFYRFLAQAARETLQRKGEPWTLSRFDGLIEEWLDSSVAFLVAQPRTLVHGDMSCVNVIVQPGDRIRPIDWESAAIGVPAWDVGKLLEGWGSMKARLLETYLEELAAGSALPVDRPAFELGLEHCKVLRTLRDLYWWKLPPDGSSGADRLLDRMEEAWQRLDRKELPV